MIENFESHQTRSSGELWSEICSALPDSEVEGQQRAEFTDSFEPPLQDSTNQNGTNGIPSSAPISPWAPMEDSEVYIASLENRLRRIKGHSQEVTSRDMLRTLSQAKKECWDRFLHDAQGSDLFQEGSDIDQNALEQLKRWLQPEKVAINAEELQYLLHPDTHRETPGPEGAEGGQSGADGEEQDEDEESQAPEK
ncbi:coiled-coil domain-containing protein 32 [Amia ocellicauda]|uniref:coiled-coil domain-containing protein 32 n=1 Tax=Amia ocellicauda TaxID=2972642 RepID=UPI003463852B